MANAPAAAGAPAAALERWHRNLLGRHLRRGLSFRVLLKVSELQLELVQQCALLGGLSELLVRSFLIVSLSLSISKLPAWASASAADRATRSARSIACNVVTSSGENHRRPSPTRDSQDAVSVRTADPATDSNPSGQPAACGRHVCCGIRQSMSSSR